VGQNFGILAASQGVAQDYLVFRCVWRIAAPEDGLARAERESKCGAGERFSKAPASDGARSHIYENFLASGQAWDGLTERSSHLLGDVLLELGVFAQGARVHAESWWPDDGRFEAGSFCEAVFSADARDRQYH